MLVFHKPKILTILVDIVVREITCDGETGMRES